MRRNDPIVNVVWLFAGVATGAAVGILIAPHAGRETRRLLGQKTQAEGREWIERGREVYDMGRQLADEAADYFEEGRRLVEG